MVVKKFLTIVLLISCLSCHKEQESERFTLLPLQAGVNVMQQGAKGDGLTDDTDAFEKAMRLADSLKKPVVIPAGKYKATIQISHDGLTLIGQGQPSETFKFGTIIIGSINCNNKKNITLQHLGIDARNSQSTAALTSGDGSDSADLYQTFSHISLLGGGYRLFNHGILCQTGRHITLRNVLVKNFYHGIALRSSEVKADSIEAICCGFTSIIIKAAEGKNARTRNIVISNVRISGNPEDPFERGGMILVQSFANESIIENIELNRISSRFSGVSTITIDQVKGEVKKVKIFDCNAAYQGHDAGTACYDIKGGTDIIFTNCSSMQARGTGFRCTGSAQKVRAEQCYESGSGMQAWWGNFSYLQLNGVEIIK